MKESRPVILCIDDDQDILDYLKIILEKENFIFAGAESAKEGMEKFATSGADLILVDLMMEEVDSGTALVRELRAVKPDLPIYLLSSVGDQFNHETDFAGLGLSGVFQKPIDPPVLISRVKRILGVR